MNSYNYSKSIQSSRQNKAKQKRSKSGFTLIELIVVIAIMALVIPLVGNSMRKLLSQTQVREAQTQLVADLTKAKTAAIRFSSPVTISFTENSYTMTQENPFSQQTVMVRNGAQLSFYQSNGSFGTTTDDIEFKSPYGEVSLPSDDQGWQIRVAKGNQDYFVKIVGLTGKVIVNNEQ